MKGCDGMKVGLSTSVIQRGKSGVGQYVLALTRALLSASSPLPLTLFVLEEDLPLFQFAQERATIVPVPERYRTPSMNILWHQFILPKLARRLELSVLHVPTYRRLLWPHPCRLVATIHDLAPFRLAKKYDRRRMAYGRFMVRRLAPRQDEIIAVSAHTAGEISAQTRLPRHRVTVIHNGIDHDRFFPEASNAARASVAQRYGLRDPYFLYVARIEHPAKNHLRLIQAFELFKKEARSRWQLVFAGSDWDGAAAVHQAARNSPFADSIHSLGFVADPFLPALYQAADIFVYPSLYEGFGIPPVEAMACGCPVICSDRGALGEVVGEAAAIIDPENPTTLQWQMTRFATDPMLRSGWRQAGLERAKRFDWHRTAASTLEVYRRATTTPMVAHN